MKNDISVTTVLRFALLALALIWTFLLMKPFIGLFAWAGILAVAIYPSYDKLVAKFGQKNRKLTSILFGVIIALLVLYPTYSITASVLQSTTNTVQDLKAGTLDVTPPTEKVKDWPLIGEKVYQNWDNLSQDTTEYALEHREVILEQSKKLFTSFGGIIGSVLLLVISFIIAVVFMYNAEGARSSLLKFSNKVMGDENGTHVLDMSKNTIRSVVKGILLVAIIQALLSFVGFKLIGLPGAGIYALIVLCAAIMQIPVMLVVIPAIMIAFSISDNTVYAVIFTVYILIVALVDNFLKPIFLSKGLETPTLIIFLGAIGGVMLHGIIGLFVGTVVMALVHRLYVDWVNNTTA